jgi:predicted nucleic acid-binding protein
MGVRQHPRQRRAQRPHPDSSAVEGLWSVLDAIRHRVELHELAPAQHKAVLAVAIDAGVSIYDAGYLWLAKSLNLPLATFDEHSSRQRPRRA